MSKGQGVLNILPLAGVKAGVDAGIESLPSDDAGRDLPPARAV